MHLGINGYMIAYVSGTMVADIGMFLSGNIMNDLKSSKSSGAIAREMVKYSACLLYTSRCVYETGHMAFIFGNGHQLRTG